MAARYSWEESLAPPSLHSCGGDGSHTTYQPWLPGKVGPAQPFHSTGRRGLSSFLNLLSSESLPCLENENTDAAWGGSTAVTKLQAGEQGNSQAEFGVTWGVVTTRMSGSHPEGVRLGSAKGRV